jgi:hypothetical protein
MSRAKKTASVTVVLALAALALTACFGPPPPPTDPHDVLVVGDSISFSFACGLGDDAGSGQSCPGPGGFTTASDIVGGCTISGGTILLYNGQTAGSYGCDNWGSAWSGDADKYTPRVVVIVTSGWEIMDRWSGDPNGLPDRQWGGNNQQFQDAKNAYQANLGLAINVFRQHGSKVIVANSAYVNPPQPEFQPGTPGAPDFLINAWYERYPLSNTGNPPEPPQWDMTQQGYPGLTYRPSKTKVEQFNNAITSVVSSFGDPSNVLQFNMFDHFDPVISGSRAYSDYVCPPPGDSADPATCSGTKILARDADGGHLSTPGGQSILNHYLQPCVEAVLAGSSTTSCQ